MKRLKVMAALWITLIAMTVVAQWNPPFGSPGIPPVKGPVTDRALVIWDGTSGALVQEGLGTVVDPSTSNMWVMGYLGIGTNSPNNRLHIVDESQNIPVRVDVQDNGKVLAWISNADQDWTFGLNPSEDFIISDDSGGASARLVILDDTGLVGIGTNEPSEELHVDGDIGLDRAVFKGIQGTNAYFQPLRVAGSNYMAYGLLDGAITNLLPML